MKWRLFVQTLLCWKRNIPREVCQYHDLWCSGFWRHQDISSDHWFHCVGQTSPYLRRGRTSTEHIISVFRNDGTCKYICVFSLKNQNNKEHICIYKTNIEIHRIKRLTQIAVVTKEAVWACAAVSRAIQRNDALPTIVAWCVITLILWKIENHDDGIKWKKSALLPLCEGNPPVAGGFPSQQPVTRSFDVSYGVHLSKRLNKKSRCWRFETPWRSFWRHYNV